MTTSDALLDAALAVVGATGVQGLTFDGVDDEAGVERGTTHAAFPTMDALIDAMVGRIITFDGLAWMSSGGDLTPTTVAEFADRMAHLTIIHVQETSVSTKARFVLFFGSPQVMTQGQAALLDLVAVILDRIGVPEPQVRARHVIDFVGGTALHYLTLRRGESIDHGELAAAFRRLLR